MRFFVGTGVFEEQDGDAAGGDEGDFVEDVKVGVGEDVLRFEEEGGDPD